MTEQVDLHFHNAMRDTRYAYWNALLTLNGIIATIFAASTFLADNTKVFTFIIVFVSICACLLIISNYKTAKTVYNKLGESTDTKKYSHLSEQEFEQFRKKEIEEATRLNKKIDRNEKVNNILIIVQLFLILILSLINII